MSRFAHLHVHTEYSILDGMTKIPAMIQKAYDDGQRAIAITDHGNMFGVFTFVAEVEKFNANHSDDPMKAIIGCEVYVARRTRFDKDPKVKEDRSGHHLVLLAKTWQGYRNLSKLVSLGYSEGMYYTPRVDKELLRKYSEGIIACSACLGGELPQAIMKYNFVQNKEEVPDSMNLEAADKIVEEFKSIYGNDYYIELQRNGHGEQKLVNEALIDLSRKHQVRCIATNDVHFLNKEDFEAHKMLICINTGKDFHDADASKQDEDADNGMMYSGQEYFKTTAEMEELFADFPEAIMNTQHIVDKVEVLKLSVKQPATPKFDVPEGFKDEYDYFEYLTYEGAKKRWPEMDDVIKQRLEFELGTVKKMGFPGYFLIVHDFINAGKQMGIRFGPGRGSAAGSAIAYCLGITNIDPIKYDLLFERFLNPDRISMPDIDIDIDDAGRGKVIQYVIDKYGVERVAQIVTFGTLAAKSAVKDCARHLGLSVAESNRLSGLIPTGPKVTLKSAFHDVPELQNELDHGSPQVQKTLQLAIKLEGTIRNRGVHACGVIIGRDNLFDAVPLCTADGKLVTEYEGSIVESAGLLKMDFLGLKTLNIIESALYNIKKRFDKDIDIDAIPLDDAKTFELFSSGDTTAVFQFESNGMRKYLQELQPQRFEDIIAMVSLYRPGPMDNIPSFINRKQGKEKISYRIPEMGKYLDITYGITVYQEQVMLLSQLLAGFTPGQADTLRKAMGKKKISLMNELKGKFIQGGMQNDHQKKDLEEIWAEWEKFASYAFNKSHATCYAFVSYQTAWLKAHYRAEFMAANLTNNLDNITEITKLTEDARRAGIKVLGPDINESDLMFTVNKEGSIRFGLAALKGMGAGAAEAVIREREENGNFTNIFDFMKRINLKDCNKRCIEAMARAGAFDGFSDIHRAQFFVEDKDGRNFLDKLVTYGTQSQSNAAQNQISMFDDVPEMASMAYPTIPQCEPWTLIECARNEKDVAGFYISGHPLDTYKTIIEHYTNVNLAQLNAGLTPFANKNLAFVGTVTSVRKGVSQKTNKDYAFMTLEDYNTSFDIGFFGEQVGKFAAFLNQSGAMLFIKARVKERRFADKDGNRSFELEIVDIFNLYDAFTKLCKSVTLCFGIHSISVQLAVDLQKIITESSKLSKDEKENSSAQPVPLVIRLLGAGDKFHSDFNNYQLLVYPEKFVKNLKLNIPYTLELN